MGGRMAKMFEIVWVIFLHSNKFLVIEYKIFMTLFEMPKLAVVAAMHNLELACSRFRLNLERLGDDLHCLSFVFFFIVFFTAVGIFLDEISKVRHVFLC